MQIDTKRTCVNKRLDYVVDVVNHFEFIHVNLIGAMLRRKEERIINKGFRNL